MREIFQQPTFIVISDNTEIEIQLSLKLWLQSLTYSQKEEVMFVIKSNIHYIAVQHFKDLLDHFVIRAHIITSTSFWRWKFRNNTIRTFVT